MTTASGLSDIMEFDCAVQVHADTTVTDADVPAPKLLDDALDTPDWEFFSTGYTGQHGYRGPIMHNSELLGGRLAQDILDTPGVYAAVVAYWSPAEGDDEELAEGWAIVHYTGGQP